MGTVHCSGAKARIDFWAIMRGLKPPPPSGLPRALDADHGDFGEAFFKDRGLEAFGHLAHHVLADRAVALAVALQADLQRHVEEDGLHLVAEALGHRSEERRVGKEGRSRWF